MKRATFISIFVAVGALVVGAIGVPGLHADEKEYKSTAKMTKLIENESLSGLPGQVANVFVAEMPGGWVGGKHYHPGHVFVYVLEGSITFTFDGKEPFTVKAGEVYHETPNENMLAKNASASEDLKLIVFQVGTEGKPVMIQAN
jgi:quercetin dioxygenase-like cupin family protein